jgi:O-antigen/teichoic acid export membrane protein
MTRMPINSVIKETIRVLALLTLAFLAEYACNVFLSRHFSPENYGDINIIFKLINVALPIFLLGIDYSIGRYLPVLIKENVKEDLSRFLRWACRSLIYLSLSIFTFAMLASLVVYLSKHPSLIGRHYDGILIAFIFPLLACSAIFNILLRYYHSYSFSVFSNDFLRHALLLGFLACSFYVFEKTDFYATFTMLAVSLFFVVLTQGAALYNKLKQGTHHRVETTNPSNWLKTSVHYMFGNFMFASLASVDLILLEALGPTEASVGYFSALFAICNILYLVSSASGMVLPKVRGAEQPKDTAIIQKSSNACLIFNILFAAPFLLGILFFGEHILGNFGASYKALYSPLVIFACGVFLVTATRNTASTLVYSNYYRHIIGMNTVALLGAIVLDVILIPTYGMYGAITSLLVISIALNLSKALLAKKVLKIKPFYFI